MLFRFAERSVMMPLLLRCVPILCCLFAVVAIAGDGVPASDAVDYLDPPQGRFIEDWMVVEFDGEKIGYAHNTMSRDGDVIVTRSLMSLKLGRAGQTIDVLVRQSTRETVAGEPLTFETDMKMSAIAMSTRGRVAKGKVHITSTQFGKDSTQTWDFPEGSKMAWGLFRAGIEHGFAPGTQYELDVYEPSIRADGALHAKNVVGGRETIRLSGRLVEAIKVTTTMTLPMGSVESVGYVDDSGNVLRAEVQFPGLGSMTLESVDKAVALAEFEPPEFFMDTLVKVNRKIDRATAEKIHYTLRLSGDGRRLPELPKTGMQTPLEQTRQSVKLIVERQNHEALRTIEPRPSGSDPTSVPTMQEFLSPSPSLNIEDEAIIAMAMEAAGGETHPYRVADKLRRYVTRIIREKNLSVGFATASEVCRTREGDCTEHAVLLAALGRERGIPSRVVVGLAYVPSFGGRKDVFGFHMWTQFRIGDQWVDFDAAMGESECSPARIALATSSLRTSAIGDLAFAIIDLLGGLKIEIDSVEPH